MPPTQTDITAIILAGGEGRRMGTGEKPLVELGEQSLLSHVIERIVPQVDAILLSCAGNEAAYRNLGFDIVSDGRPDCGPLAGIEAGLAQASTERCLVCPADMPALPANLVGRLLEAKARLAYAITPSRAQPLVMLLQRQLLPLLSASLDDGVRSVHDWVAHAGGVAVAFPDAAAFDNINTPADLDRWHKEKGDETSDPR